MKREGCVGETVEKQSNIDPGRPSVTVNPQPPSTASAHLLQQLVVSTASPKTPDKLYCFSAKRSSNEVLIHGDNGETPLYG